MKLKSLSLLLFFLIFTASCGDKDDAKSKVEESAKVAAPESVEASKKDEAAPPSVSQAVVPSADIMKQLPGTDACFEAVELIRDEGDAATFFDLGDSILLKEGYVERHGQKTYFGTIGRMLKEKKSIPEIRQTLLNKCRAFEKAYYDEKKRREESK